MPTYGNPGVWGTAGPLNLPRTGNPGVWGTAGPAKPKKKKPVVTTPARKPPEMSAAEWARIQAEKYITAQIEDIARQREQYLQSLRRDSDLAAQRGLDLSKALQSLNIPGQVQQIYGNASADIGGLAQAFSGQLRGVAEADAAQQTRMVSGTGQEGAVRNEGVGMGDVLYGGQGYVPARNMSETGAAFAAQASLEPGYAAQFGQESAESIYSEGLEGLSEFTEAERDVRSEQFDMEQELLGFRQEQEQAATKAVVDQQKEYRQRLKDERDWYTKQAYLALASGDRKRSNQYLNLAKEREQRMQAHDQGYDMEGQLLPGYKMGPNGIPQKISTAKASKAATKTKSARKERESEYLKAQKSLSSDIEDLSVKVPGKYGAADTVRRPSYALAFRKLMEKYKYLLRYAGKNGQKQARARLVKMIEEALMEAGIVQSRGAAGHPGK
jgi:hypothetical protein